MKINSAFTANIVAVAVLARLRPTETRAHGHHYNNNIAQAPFQIISGFVNYRLAASPSSTSTGIKNINRKQQHDHHQRRRPHHHHWSTSSVTWHHGTNDDDMHTPQTNGLSSSVFSGKRHLHRVSKIPTPLQISSTIKNIYNLLINDISSRVDECIKKRIISYFTKRISSLFTVLALSLALWWATALPIQPSSAGNTDATQYSSRTIQSKQPRPSEPYSSSSSTKSDYHQFMQRQR